MQHGDFKKKTESDSDARPRFMEICVAFWEPYIWIPSFVVQIKTEACCSEDIQVPRPSAVRKTKFCETHMQSFFLLLLGLSSRDLKLHFRKVLRKRFVYVCYMREPSQFCCLLCINVLLRR